MYIWINVELSKEDRVKPMKYIIEELTDKEKKIIKESLTALSINYSPDYPDYMWDIVKLVIGKDAMMHIPDIDYGGYDEIIELLDPKWGTFDF